MPPPWLGEDAAVVHERTLLVSKGNSELQFNLNTRQGQIQHARGEYSWLVPLHKHPNKQQLHQGAYRPCIMTVEHASHVCDYLAPDFTQPSHAIQVVKGFDREEREFLHVLWGRLELVDKLRDVEKGSTERELREARKMFCKDSEDQALGQVSGGGGLASASGEYRECGFGALPGIRRPSIHVGGKATNTPFTRSSESTRDLEGAFSDVLKAASVLTEAACEGMLEREMREACGESPRLARALQYPRVSRAQHWPTHQVAYRGAGLPHGVTKEGRLRHALGVSDLHVDVMDGTTLGNANVYACFVHEGEEVDQDVYDERLHVSDDNDVCVFPPITRGGTTRVGGRGFQVRTMIPNWLCVMIFQTRSCLHGSVCTNNLPQFVDREGQIAGRIGIRCIPYPLRPLLALLERAHDSAAVARQLQSLAMERGDWYLLQRLHEEFPFLSS